MFREQGRRFAATLARYASRFAEAITEDELATAWGGIVVTTSDPLIERLDTEYARLLGKGAGQAIAELSVGIENPAGLITFDVGQSDAVSWLGERGATRVAGINATTQAELAELLAQAVDEGWSYARTAKEITARFRGFSAASPLKHIRNRAELIAVSEAAEAYEHGRLLVSDRFAAAGLPVEHAWLTVGDEDVCEVCAPAGAQGFIAKASTFVNGLSFPPGHPGCRCTGQVRVARSPSDN
jgi:SPP1 gp7 family putative phage head morphogenesis protein